MEISLPRLIVDKEGKLGALLQNALNDERSAVFVSKNIPENCRNIVPVLYSGRIPKIPDNSYAEIVIIYRGEKELKDALPSFLKKAQETQAHLFFITDIFHYPQLYLERLVEDILFITVFVLGDEFFLPRATPLNLLLHEAKEYGRVTLPGSGLTQVYPVATVDVIEAIQVVMKMNKRSGIFALYPQYPPSMISITRILQKLYPSLNVDFSKKKSLEVKYSFPKNPVYIYHGNYPLEKRLKEVDMTATPLLPAQKKKKKRLKTHRSSKRWIFLCISILFFLIALPSLVSLSFATGGGIFLLRSQNALEQGEFKKAEQSALAGKSLFSVAKTSVQTIKASVGVLVGEDELLGLERTMENGEKVALILSSGAKAGARIDAVVSGTSQDPKKDFYEGSSYLQESLTLFKQMQVEGQIPDAFVKKLEPLEKSVTLLLNTIDAYPYLLGFEKKQSYLILFQNNFELRSTGGFIGSYGLLEIEKGRVLSFVIQDVYETDGQLKEHLDPPFPLRRYMGASHWYLRDSNYSLDFPTAAAQAADFFERTEKKKVDGVIALDTTFLSSILDVIGPIELVDYKETITKDNFFLTTQKHVEEEFFPGSTQKRDYLRSLHSSVEKKLLQGEISFIRLFKLITDNIEQKHISIAVADASLQRLFTVNNLSASLWDGREDDNSLVNDYLSINETNIGLNKSNFYLRRKIDQNVTIDGEGKIMSQVLLKYSNTSTFSSEFGGEYKAYLRVVVPQDAVLSGFAVDGVQRTVVPAITDPAVYTQRNFRQPQEFEIEEGTVMGKKVFGFLIQVPSQKIVSYTIEYTLSDSFPFAQPESRYIQKVVKQPGTLQDPYTLTLRYPLSMRLLESSSGVSNVGGKIVYQAELLTDKDIILRFVSNTQ